MSTRIYGYRARILYILYYILISQYDLDKPTRLHMYLYDFSEHRYIIVIAIFLSQNG